MTPDPAGPTYRELVVDEYGNRLDHTAVVQVVQRVGAMMVWLSPAETVHFDAWRRTMLAAGREHNMRLRVRRTRSGGVVVSNPDHVHNPRRLRDTITALISTTRRPS